MPGTVNFNVSVYVDGGEVPKFMADRLSDLSPFFNLVIEEWAKDNETKFARGVGAEASGVEVDPGVYWKPLSPAYLEQKEKEGLAGALMVRTGSLRSALTDSGMMLREVTTENAIFGEPIDPFDAMKISENWDSRQAIFISGRDRMMIEEKLIKHISPSSFSSTPFTQRKAEIDSMNAEFQGLIGDTSE